MISTTTLNIYGYRPDNMQRKDANKRYHGPHGDTTAPAHTASHARLESLIVAKRANDRYVSRNPKA